MQFNVKEQEQVHAVDPLVRLHGHLDLELQLVQLTIAVPIRLRRLDNRKTKNKKSIFNYYFFFLP